MRSLDWNLRTTMIHDMIACYCEAYFSMLSSWWFDSDTLISQFPTFSATIMIISYDNDILIFDMNSVIKIISRYYHSIITKISVKYQNINNQTNDILSWYFDKPQYCTLVCALSYTQSRATHSPVRYSRVPGELHTPLLRVSQCLFVTSYRFPLALTHLYPNACMIRVHSFCVTFISRTFRWKLFPELLHTQPRAFPLGFLVRSLLGSLYIYRGSPVCIPVCYTLRLLWVPSYISRAFTVRSHSFSSDAPCIQCANRAHASSRFAVFSSAFRGSFLVFLVLPSLYYLMD